MRTLRAPKTLYGLARGIPSFIWHEAACGMRSFEAHDRVWREHRMAHLARFRRVLDLPVENGTRVAGILLADDSLALDLEGRGGRERATCRALVLAAGIAAAGSPVVTDPVRRLAPERRTQSDGTLDAAVLAGRDAVAIIAGTSAFDRAVTALDAGAQSVELVARSGGMRVTEVLDWSNVLEHFAELPDDWRPRFMNRRPAFRAPPTQEMHDRVTADRRLRMRMGDFADAAFAYGRVHPAFRDGTTKSADRCLLGTGGAVDLARRPELASLARRVALRRDRHDPPPDGEHASVIHHPSLGPAFACQEREPRTAPHAARVRVFDNGAVPSRRPVRDGLTGRKRGASRRIAGSTRRLFMKDGSTRCAALGGFGKRHFHPRHERSQA